MLHIHIKSHRNLGSPPLASIYVEQDIIKQLPSEARYQEMAFTHCKSIIIANQVLISQQKQITGHTCRGRKHFVTSNYSTRNFPTSRQLQAFFSCKQFATCILLIQAYGNQANRLQAFVLTSICPSSKSPQANVPQQIGASDCPSAFKSDLIRGGTQCRRPYLLTPSILPYNPLCSTRQRENSKPRVIS